MKSHFHSVQGSDFYFYFFLVAKISHFAIYIKSPKEHGQGKFPFWKFSQKTFCQIYLEEKSFEIVKIFGGFGQISSSVFFQIFLIYFKFIFTI
jgi:hypothetical protein